MVRVGTESGGFPMEFATVPRDNPPTMQIAVAPKYQTWVVTADSVIRRDAVLVAGLLLLGAVMPIALGLAAGSQDIPRNDDWSYRMIALHLYASGRIAFDTVAAPTLIGQILLVQPLLWVTRGDPVAFTIAGTVIALACPLVAYGLARLLVPPARAFVAALALIMFPGYLAYATSFMTDAPALVAELGALAIGVRALRAERTNLVAAAVAMAIALVAFSIRQVGLAAVLAITLAVLVREPRRPGAWAVGVAGLVGTVLMVIVRSGIAGEATIIASQVWFVTRLPQAVVSVSLMALPAAIVSIALNRHAWRGRDAGYGLLVGLGIVGTIVAHWIRVLDFPDALIGNLTSQQGVLDVLDLTGGRPLLFTDAFWAAINLLGVVAVPIVSATLAASVGVHLAGRRTLLQVIPELGTPTGLIAAFVLAYAGGLVLHSLSGIVFDRYLWPIAPCLAILLLGPVRSFRSGRVWAEAEWGRILRSLTIVPLAVLTLTGIVALTLMANAFAFDAARWRAGEHLAASGLAAGTIDAGYEWVGSHAPGSADMTRTGTPTAPYRSWWADLHICGLVTASATPPAGGRLIGTASYRLYLVAGPSVDLYLYRTNLAGCPAEDG